MKKLFTISLAVFYLATASGVTVNVHYCMGQVASVKLFLDSNGCCCSDQKPMEGCCDDESFFFQVDDDHKAGKTFLTFETPKQKKERFVPAFTDLEDVVNKAFRLEFLDLPPPNKKPVWLINCALTYYG